MYVTVNQFDIILRAFLEGVSGNWIASLKWIWDNSTPATALWGSFPLNLLDTACTQMSVPSQRFGRVIWTVWTSKSLGTEKTIWGHGCWQLMGPQPFRMSQVYMSLPLSKRYERSLLLSMNFSFSCSRFRTWKLTRGNHWKPLTSSLRKQEVQMLGLEMSVQKWSRDPCHSAVTDKRVGLEVVELNCNKKLCEINIHLFKGPVDQGLPVVCHRTTQKNTWKAGCFSMFLCLALFSKAMIFRWHIKSVLDGHRLGRMAVSTSFETCWNHFHWIREWETWMSIRTIPYHSIPYHTIPYYSIPSYIQKNTYSNITKQNRSTLFTLEMSHITLSDFQDFPNESSWA